MAFGAVTKTMAGRVLIEASTGKASTRYQLEQGATAIQPSDITIIGAQLLNLYDAAVAQNQGADDATLKTWMLGQLQIVRSFSTDHTDALQR